MRTRRESCHCLGQRKGTYALSWLWLMTTKAAPQLAPITPAYEQHADPVIELQLEKAGVRLAHLLKHRSEVKRPASHHSQRSNDSLVGTAGSADYSRRMAVRCFLKPSSTCFLPAIVLS